MRLELTDVNANRYCCDTYSATVAAAWLKDWLPYALNVNVTLRPWQLQVWAMSHEERASIGQNWNRLLDLEGLEAARDLFIAAASKTRQQIDERREKS